jgi:hypothetical protein
MESFCFAGSLAWDNAGGRLLFGAADGAAGLLDMPG